jgi:hypothetical protein
MVGAVVKKVVIDGVEFAIENWNKFKKIHDAIRLDLKGIENIPTARNLISEALKLNVKNVPKFVNRGDSDGLMRALEKQIDRSKYTPKYGQQKPYKKYTEEVDATVTDRTSKAKASGGKVYGNSTRKPKYKAG